MEGDGLIFRGKRCGFLKAGEGSGAFALLAEDHAEHEMRAGLFVVPGNLAAVDIRSFIEAALGLIGRGEQLFCLRQAGALLQQFLHGCGSGEGFPAGDSGLSEQQAGLVEVGKLYEDFFQSGGGADGIVVCQESPCQGHFD